MLDVIGVIPARYASSRFPGKPLVKICGKPMIIWVAEAAAAALGKSNVVVATDDERILKTAEGYGYRAMITSSACLTGTDRVYEVAKEIDAGVYINIQGDEPLINPQSILDVYDLKRKNHSMVVNCMSRVRSHENPASLNMIKVVTNKDNRLIYMSRNLIPATKSREGFGDYYKQVCIYGFNREQLMAFGSSGRKTRLEAIEDIEILRFFDLGYHIYMLEVETESHGVDEQGDVAVIEKILMEKGYKPE